VYPSRGEHPKVYDLHLWDEEEIRQYHELGVRAMGIHQVRAQSRIPQHLMTDETPFMHRDSSGTYPDSDTQLHISVTIQRNPRPIQLNLDYSISARPLGNDKVLPTSPYCLRVVSSGTVTNGDDILLLHPSLRSRWYAMGSILLLTIFLALE
jgi:hypothetical protein